METVNSLSGGKTSSYLAYHYPADYELFALVCIDDHNAGRDIPKSLKQKVNDKLQKYSSHWPEFRATAEDPKTLTAIFDLEQLIGREITWLRGIGWEEMMVKKKAVPNRTKRFCTTMMKFYPIFEFCYLYTDLPVEMRIGYRYDEKERIEKFTELINYPYKSQFYPNSQQWQQRWKDYQWRIGSFPLVNDKVFHHQIQNFWKGYDIEFPTDSNCQNCFWKHEQQLRKNMETNTPIMQWAKVMEEIHGHTFRDEYSLLQIEKMGIQQDFNFGTGSGCQAGFCTD